MPSTTHGERVPSMARGAGQPILGVPWDEIIHSLGPISSLNPRDQWHHPPYIGTGHNVRIVARSRLRRAGQRLRVALAILRLNRSGLQELSNALHLLAFTLFISANALEISRTGQTIKILKIKEKLQR